MTSDEFSFRPTAGLDTLQKRSQLLSKIRDFFESRDFIHVETPLVSRDTVVDRHIEPVRFAASALIEGLHGEGEVFLQTSPELLMKRLIASGAKAIYQVCRAFRKGEYGRHHNPEFTMLEWYRVGDDMEQAMELLADFAMHLLGIANVRRSSYREAFRRHASIDPFDCDTHKVRSVCQRRGVDVATFADDRDLDSWLNVAMSELVEPNLGLEFPEIVYHWPASQSALAKVCQDSEGNLVAERFELFYRATELANGYHELLDANELRRRNAKVNAQRKSDGAAELSVESKLLQAMENGLPACSGVALGVDRLLMVLLEKQSISEVIAFPIERA